MKKTYYFCDEFEDIRQENMFFIFSCYHFTYHVFRWIEKQVILKSSHFSEHKKEESIMHLCFLSINNNYRNLTSLNLISEVQFKEKWVKTWVLINSKCESTDTINMRYVQKHHLKTQKLKYNIILKNFNDKIILIIYMIIMKLWFNKHVKHIELYVHDLKNKYDMIFKFK